MNDRTLRLALIPLGIGVNMAIGTMVYMLKLPIYLDAIGTIIVTLLAGLRPGILTAVLTQIIAGYTINPVLPYFIPTGVAIAVYVHIAARWGAFRTLGGTVVAGLGLGIVAGLVSAPIIVYVFGGVTATGRSVLTAYLLSAGERVLKAVLLSGAAAEPLDKTLQCILVVWLLNAVPQSLIRRFYNGNFSETASPRPVVFPLSFDHRPVVQGIHPVVRGVATLFGIAGTLIAKEPVFPLFFWLGILVPLCLFTGLARKHIRMVGGVVLPLAIVLVAVWGVIVGAPPGAPPGSDPDGGVRYAALIALKLTVLAGLFQLCFMSIPQSELLSTFWHWGIRGDYLIVAIGAFTIWPEFKLRAEQILTARFARGLMPDRRLFTRFFQLPYMLRPLLVWSLRAAVQRSEMWGQRHLLDRLGEMRHTYQGAWISNTTLFLLSIAWVGLQWIKNP